MLLRYYYVSLGTVSGVFKQVVRQSFEFFFFKVSAPKTTVSIGIDIQPFDHSNIQTHVTNLLLCLLLSIFSVSLYYIQCTLYAQLQLANGNRATIVTMRAACGINLIAPAGFRILARIYGRQSEIRQDEDEDRGLVSSTQSLILLFLD